MRLVRLCTALCGLILIPHLTAQAQASSVSPLSPVVTHGNPVTPDQATQGSATSKSVPTSSADLPETDSFAGDEQADPNTSLILDNADTFTETQAGKWIGQGHVRVRYKGYVLTSDRVDTDLDAEEALFTGHVVVIAPDGQTVQGGPNGALRLNLRNSTYAVIDARTTVPPRDLTVGIILPVFVYGGTITGRPGLIDARDSQFTTCDFIEPHYSFGVSQLYIIPGRRLVAKRVTLFRKGHRIITLPYFFVPLDRRLSEQTLVPEVGETPDEGYFVKAAVAYALTSQLPGILNLNAMQKKGLETGFQQDYGSPYRPREGSGTVSLDHLRDQSTGQDDLTGSLTHRQLFGTVNAALTTNFEQNSYYAGTGSSKNISSQLNLTRNVGNLDLVLLTNLTLNNYGLGQSETLTSSFDPVFRPTNHSQLTGRFDFSQTQSPSFGGVSGSDQERLDSNLDYTQQGHIYDLEILGNNYTQLSGGTNGFYGGLERQPEVRFATDALRMAVLQEFLPRTTKMSLSLGDFLEPSSQIHTQRVNFEADTGTVTRSFGSRNTFTFGGSFQQDYYADNTAQYILNGLSSYRLKIGSKSSAGVTYTYLRPYGFTPFQFDFSGRTNNAALSFGYQETPQFRLALATAYDFNQARAQNGFGGMPWQNLSAQMLIAPGAIFRLLTTAAYDLNNHRPLDYTNYLQMRAHGGFALDVASDYSPLVRRFSNVNGSLDLPFLRDPNPEEDAGWRLRAIGGYNGITSQFNYKGLALTRSWHDWEATLIYQDDMSGLRPGSTFTFNFRLKAFPAVEPFAIGQFGQSLASGVGQVY